MYKKSFENYKVEDFISDESFTNYHFHLNEKDTAFWEEWLVRNPSKKNVAKEAGQIIQSLSLTLSEKEYQDEFNKIKTAIGKKEPSKGFRFLSWNKIYNSDRKMKNSIQYILLILLFSAAATYLLTQRFDNKKFVVNKTVNSKNKTVVFTLDDSTVVTLAPNSSLHYPSSFQGENRHVYLKGEAGFNVKRNEQFPFKVHSENIVAIVLGTIFNIKKTGDSAIVVELLKGKLNVEIEDTTISLQHPILLYPNEQAIYVFHDKHLYKHSEVLEYSVSFQKNNFKEIAARLKDVFGVTVINLSNQKNWLFTGKFKNTTANEIIENICLVKNLNSKVEGDTIFIND